MFLDPKEIPKRPLRAPRTNCGGLVKEPSIWAARFNNVTPAQLAAVTIRYGLSLTDRDANIVLGISRLDYENLLSEAKTAITSRMRQTLSIPLEWQIPDSFSRKSLDEVPF